MHRVQVVFNTVGVTLSEQIEGKSDSGGMDFNLTFTDGMTLKCAVRAESDMASWKRTLSETSALLRGAMDTMGSGTVTASSPVLAPK